MDEAMRTYFLRYRFTHPTTEDFLRTIEEVAIARGKAIAIRHPPPAKIEFRSMVPSRTKKTVSSSAKTPHLPPEPKSLS